MKSNKTHIDNLLMKYNFKWFCFALLLLLSVASWLLIPFFNNEISWPAVSIIFLIITLLPVFPFLSNHFRKQRKKKLIEKLNECNGSLNYSSRLLLKNEAELNVIEALQVERITTHLKQNKASIKYEDYANAILVFFFLNVFVVLAFSFWFSKTPKIDTVIFTEQEAIIQQKNELLIVEDTLKLIHHNVTIKPPIYTNLKTITQKTLNISAPEGSTIIWNYKFNKKSAIPLLYFANKSLPFISNTNFSYSAKFQANENAIYTVTLNDSILSPYVNTVAEIKLVEDQNPIIKITDITAYEELDFNNINSINFNYVLSDDYAIANAAVHLIHSSGKGEGVSFKEDYIVLKGIENNASYKKTIDLKPYKAAPGDEFYIRIKATDNKPKKPNISYSSTYIMAVLDTSKTLATFEMNLGMDIEPEYFRSQRQLIIDTERLLKQQEELSNTAFKEESNNIGIEQKLLRLRYGKFLGEEFEGEIGVRKDETKVATTNEVAEVETIRFEEEHHHEHGEDCDHDEPHQHNEAADHHGHHNEETDYHEHHNEETDHHEHHTVNEKHVVEEGASEDEHEHHHEHDHHGHNHSTNEDPEAVEDLLTPFVHFHDSGEINTFFESEVKSKLKAALAEMWQSELQLRIGNPEASLAFQHKALKLIKEVQQASRIYVERVGISMPEIPIAKKRLTGELDAIDNFSSTASFEKGTKFSELKNILTQFNEINVERLKPSSISTSSIKLINNLMQRLLIDGKDDPVKFSKAIFLSQQLLINKNDTANNFYKLKRHLNTLMLRIEAEQSGKKITQNTRLNNLFQQYLHN